MDHLSDSKVPQLIATFVASLILIYVAVVLRFISRFLSKTAIGADDWIIASSLPFTTGFIVIDLVMINVGFGRHESLVTNPAMIAKGILACQILYSVTIAAFKISTLFLLRRIFPGRDFVRTLIAVGMLVIAYSLVQIVSIVLTCIPLEAIWNPQVKGHCINVDDIFIVCGAFNIATDVILLSLPMPKLWKLQISRTQKAQLTVLFLLGGLVCIFSIIRTTILKKVSTTDSSYSDYSGTVWSSLEMAVGTLSACMPTMRPIIACGRRTQTTRRMENSGNSTVSKYLTRSRQGHIVTTTVDAHPFSHPKNNARDQDRWVDNTSLGFDHRGPVENDELPLNEIYVLRDLEQSTYVDTS